MLIVKSKARSYEKKEATKVKSELTNDEIGALLDDAESAFPDSEFVTSVRDWFDDKGFITDKQESALENVIDKSNN